MLRHAEKRVDWAREDLERERKQSRNVFLPVWWQGISTICTMVFGFLVLLALLPPIPGSRWANAMAALRGDALCFTMDRSIHPTLPKPPAIEE
jgi:hypothetical protein